MVHKAMQVSLPAGRAMQLIPAARPPRMACRRLQKASTCPSELPEDILAAALEASQMSFVPSGVSRPGRPYPPPSSTPPAPTGPAPGGTPPGPLHRPPISPSPPTAALHGFAAPAPGPGSGGASGASGPSGGSRSGSGTSGSRGSGTGRSRGASAAGSLQRGASLQLQRATSDTERLFAAQADATTAQAQVCRAVWEWLLPLSISSSKNGQGHRI